MVRVYDKTMSSHTDLYMQSEIEQRPKEFMAFNGKYDPEPESVASGPRLGR